MKTNPKSPLQGVTWPTEPFLVATLPLPPGVNASYKIVDFKTQKGNWVRRPGATPELEQFKKDAHLCLLGHATENWNVLNAIKANKNKVPLAVRIDFYFKTLWLHDIDGCIKAAMDAVFKYIGLNDNTVVDLHVRKFVSKDPRCEISICVQKESVAIC